MRVLLAGVCSFLIGCGAYFAPWETTRAVAAADVAGEWHYRPPGTNDFVVLVLKTDGSFLQSVTTGSSTLTQNGTWALAGAKIELRDPLVDFQGWKPATAGWRIIDRKESPTGFAIFGGTTDPDGWIVLDWIRPAG